MTIQRTTAMNVILVASFAMAPLAMHACSSDAPDTVPPAAVSDLTLLRASETSATLTWTAPGDDGTDGCAAGYDLRYSLTEFPAGWDSATVVEGLAVPCPAGQADTATVTGLARDHVYFFALRTLDDAGQTSELSNVVTAQTNDPEPPAQVTDLRAVVLEPHAVTLWFTAPGDDGSQGTAAAYEFRHAAAAITESSWEEATVFPSAPAPHVAGTSETVRVNGLSPEQTFHIAVRARDDAGQEGPVSNDVEVTLPLDTVAPAAIQDLTVNGPSPFAAVLTWTAPGNDGDEGRASGYAVRYATTPITEASWSEATAVPASLSPAAAGETETLTLTDLPGGHDLWFSVRATDERGNQGTVSNSAKTYVRVEPKSWVVRKDGSGDATTVQAGINLAAPGDTVRVGPGTYTENIDLLGKALYLQGAGPEATILDGSAAKRPTVTCASGEPRGTTITGFTIQGGRGFQQSGAPHLGGGGVFIVDSEPTIEGNVIRGNVTEGAGGGIYCSGYRYGRVWSIEIRNNTVGGNQARYQGGGVYCGGNAAVLIEGNDIHGNIVTSGDGAGISLLITVPGSLVRGNRIVGNEAGDHGGGIVAVKLSDQPPFGIDIAWNLVSGNAAHHKSDTDEGGGGIVIGDLDAHIYNNTVVANSCGGGLGGGIAIILDGVCDVTRNIVAFNDGGSGIACSRDGHADVYDNLLWGNAPELAGFDCGGVDGPNLAADPLFCDQPGGDYSLAANSPALTHPAGPLGAFPTAGCAAMESKPLSWGRINTLYQ